MASKRARRSPAAHVLPRARRRDPVIQIAPPGEHIAQPYARVAFPDDVPAWQLRREADPRAQAIVLAADRGGGEQENIHAQRPRKYCASGYTTKTTARTAKMRPWTSTFGRLYGGD